MSMVINELFIFLLLRLCYGFVLLSSATGASNEEIGNFFPKGNSWTYLLDEHILLNEEGENEKDVGFLIKGTLIVDSLWGDKSERLLQFHLKSPKLHIRSRKAPAPDGFISHSSNLDKMNFAPFLIHWKQGRIEKILLEKDEVVSIANLKKGIASLFQFQINVGENNETDSSGNCLCEYNSNGLMITKRKLQCFSDFPYFTNPDLALSTQIKSERINTYQLNEEKNWFLSTQVQETHRMVPTIKEDLGNTVQVYQSLKLQKTDKINQLSGNSFEEVSHIISRKLGVIFTHESLLTERELNEDQKSFVKIVGENREKLKKLGTISSAKVITRLVNSAQSSNREDIVKALSSKKNKDILFQLYDILGFIQTYDSHEAAMKKLHFDDKKQEDLSERYLWALSFSSQPNPDVIKDLISKLKVDNLPPKVKETMLLTVSAMAYRLSKLENHRIQRTVEEFLLNSMDYAKEEDRNMYLRALKNLRSKTTVENLLNIIRNSTNKQEVLAWSALKALGLTHWNKSILNQAFITLFELDKKHDSSARTLAADILLESNPDEETLKALIYHLVSNCPMYEVKQYILQRIKMMGENNEEFRRKVWGLIQRDSKLNNYSVLGLKGLSTALDRKFLTLPNINGSLLTVQEMSGMTVKRGIVDIVLEKSGKVEEIFSLGLFSRGLNSFISSDPNNPDGDDVATAGMELSVLGTQIRPFIFFYGQGELMGHVWSGTASEMTPAFQVLALLQNHHEFLRLSSGFIAELDLKGAISFDLSGKAELSLWNRNAASVVEKSAGIVLEGLIRVDTSFVKSQVEFSASFEPKLHLQTDIDFYSTVNLCMRLSQPSLTFKHNVYKIERIPGSKHRLRKVKYHQEEIPGKTYSLNKKNNEMCNLILKGN